RALRGLETLRGITGGDRRGQRRDRRLPGATAPYCSGVERGMKKGPPLAERPLLSSSFSRSAVPLELLRLARRFLRDHDVDQRRTLERGRLLQGHLGVLPVLA